MRSSGAVAGLTVERVLKPLRKKSGGEKRMQLQLNEMVLQGRC